MPQLFKIGAYRVFFRANDSDPPEPFHVHICEGEPQKDATKVWITRTGHVILCHNKSRIPSAILRRILQMIEANSDTIREKWLELFGDITCYC